MFAQRKIDIKAMNAMKWFIDDRIHNERMNKSRYWTTKTAWKKYPENSFREK